MNPDSVIIAQILVHSDIFLKLVLKSNNMDNNHILLGKNDWTYSTQQPGSGKVNLTQTKENKF